mmetsp:Transcript_2379/g.3775  ORF Transcript_2379/g.3775 Transcript_2379/m.3775 type:complete len:110 (-) Transcript_2379:33-362(-)
MAIIMLRSAATKVSNFRTTLPSWEVLEPSGITKTFVFADELHTWNFIKLLCKVSENKNCFPSVKFNSKEVQVLISPSEGDLLANRDIWLASFMDKAEQHVKDEEQEEIF